MALKFSRSDDTVTGTIVIKGDNYGLEYRPEWSPRSIQLTKLASGDQYSVERNQDDDASDYMLTEGSANHKWECDCPDFLNRHAGTGSDGCKHILAIVGQSFLMDHFDDVDRKALCVAKGEPWDAWHPTFTDRD